MARKSGPRSRYSGAPDSDIGKSVSDSAQKIWLAGLGAYERAKAEGPKVFDALVEQGKGLRAKARDAADQALRTVRDGASGAGQRFDKLEQVFEDRVSKSLARMGVLTRGEVSDLTRQVRDLTEDVRKLMKQTGRKAAGGKARRAGAKRKVKRPASRSRARKT